MNFFEYISLGHIVSLILAVMVLLLVIMFFIKRKTPALAIIYGVVLLVCFAIYVVSWYFPDFELATSIATWVAIVMGCVAVVVYQNELKGIFFMLSKRLDKKQKVSFSSDEIRKAIAEIVKACQNMSKAKTGVLIVISPTRLDDGIVKSGTMLNAILSAPLLESIFNTKAPLHDGAVVVQGNQVIAAGCFMSRLSDAKNISADIGTRHRAAMGFTENNDGLCIVVSEENGIISIAKKGILKRYITPERLSDILYETYGVSAGMQK